MVGNVTSLTGNGLRDWVIQRVSAVLLLFYTIYLTYFGCTHPDLQFNQWHSLFTQTWFKIFTLISLLSIILHSWIGIWTVFTDYIKPLAIRMLLQVSMITFLVVYFIWGFLIVWSGAS